MCKIGGCTPRSKWVGDPDPVAVQGAGCAGWRKPAEELIQGFGELLRGAVAFVGVVGFLRRWSGGGDVFEGEGCRVGEGSGEGSRGEVGGRRFV